MVLLDVLKLIDKNAFPLTFDEKYGIDSRPDSLLEVTLCFMCEEETWITCNIKNEILIPWYECEVTCIHPDSEHENAICVWLNDTKYLQKNYPQHLKEVNQK